MQKTGLTERNQKIMCFFDRGQLRSFIADSIQKTQHWKQPLAGIAFLGQVRGRIPVRRKKVCYEYTTYEEMALDKNERY